MNNTSLVILAAGKGTRFLPLTQTTPKPMVKICGKPAIEYTIEAALPYINEIILVVGYLSQNFKGYFGESYKGVPIKYVEQTQQLGTAHAFFTTQNSVQNEKILLVYGDDFYSRDIIHQIMTKNRAILGKVEQNWQNFGVLKCKNENFLDQIIEKPTEFVGDLVNIGVYLLDKNAYSYFDKVQSSIRGEFEFTDLVGFYAKDYQIEVVKIENGWIPLSYPWQLFELTRFQLTQMETKNEGIIEKGVFIKGKLVLGKGSIIKSGARLEGDFFIGEDCIIGPNCNLKGFGSIGNGCILGQGVEFDSSIFGNNTKISNLAYISESIFGNGIRIGAGTIVANGRLSRKNFQMSFGGKSIDTGTTRMGAILGDGVKLGINTSVYPGVTIGSKTTTLPGETIKANI